MRTFLDAFKEGIVVYGPNCGFLVGVVFEDLLAMCLFDLLVGGLVPVLGKPKHCIVILVLEKKNPPGKINPTKQKRAIGVVERHSAVPSSPLDHEIGVAGLPVH